VAGLQVANSGMLIVQKKLVLDKDER